MFIFVGETLLIRLVFIGSNTCEPSSSEIQGEVWITEGGGFVEIGGGGGAGAEVPLSTEIHFPSFTPVLGPVSGEGSYGTYSHTSSSTLMEWTDRSLGFGRNLDALENVWEYVPDE